MHDAPPAPEDPPAAPPPVPPAAPEAPSPGAAAGVPGPSPAASTPSPRSCRVCGRALHPLAAVCPGCGVAAPPVRDPARPRDADIPPTSALVLVVSGAVLGSLGWLGAIVVAYRADPFAPSTMLAALAWAALVGITGWGWVTGAMGQVLASGILLGIGLARLGDSVPQMLGGAGTLPEWVTVFAALATAAAGGIALLRARGIAGGAAPR